MKIFDRKIKNNRIKYYLFGVRIYKSRNLVSRLYKEFAKNKKFDTSKLDQKIAKLADKFADFPEQKVKNPDKNRVAFLATRLYDVGGHTKLIDGISEMLSDKYETQVFLSNKRKALGEAKVMMAQIEKHTPISDTLLAGGFKDKLDDLYAKIVEFSPRVIFVYIHTNDVLAVAALALIKKHTNIKVIYSNHASHAPALGFSFADLILEGMSTTHYITKHFRKQDRCMINGLYGNKKENIPNYSKFQIDRERRKYGVKSKNYFTLSGGASYKFFDGDSSPYFEMIKNLLKKESNLIHVIATNITDKQEKIVKKIFGASQTRRRLRIVPFLKDYMKTFKSCDVYIDSSPIGGALTQIDLMKLKTATTIRINRDNAIYSFHEYAPENYPYMFDNADDMLKGVLKLLRNEDERIAATEMLYQHYLSRFETEAKKQKYIKLIENSEDLSVFYDKLDEKLKYNFKNIS